MARAVGLRGARQRLSITVDDAPGQVDNAQAGVPGYFAEPRSPAIEELPNLLGRQEAQQSRLKFLDCFRIDTQGRDQWIDQAGVDRSM